MSDLGLYFPDEKEEHSLLVKNEWGIREYKTVVEGGQQVLGLMTKAQKISKQKYTTYHCEEEEIELEEKEELASMKMDYFLPPSEDQLTKHSLWPELNKLYGHGYEIKTLACSSDGKLIASSCKSQKAEHSSIFLWCSASYQMLAKLEGHNYTVVQLEFSKNDLFLGSVSRDRQLCVYKRANTEEIYKNFFICEGHVRIIWSLSFSHDEKFVATGSRDKKVKIWEIDNENAKLSVKEQRNFVDSVTAVAFAKRYLDEKKSFLLMVGLENGQLFILKYKEKLEELLVVDKFIGHSKLVSRIKFNRVETKNEEFQVATSSYDNSVRIFKIIIR